MWHFRPRSPPPHSLEHRGLQADLPAAVVVLGHLAEDLRLHLRLHHARAHHHRLLRPDGPAPQKRAHAVGLPGEPSARFESSAAPFRDTDETALECIASTLVPIDFSLSV